MSESEGQAEARSLDAEDPLRGFRQRFVLDDPGLTYLDGNSLGRLPREAVETARRVVAVEWGSRLIRSWNDGWIDLPVRLGDKLARIVGARPGSVLLADATTVNLYKLVHSALAIRPDRSHIVTDDFNFPSDLYVLQAAARHSVTRVAHTGSTPDVEAIGDAIDSRTALLTLSHVAFKSAALYPMATLTHLAAERGALSLWDLSHSAGALPVPLAESGADLAVGCTYKYLNGGPGAPAFLYVRPELQGQLANPIPGWLGREDPFSFDPEYAPAPGLRRLLTGTPPIVSLALIEPGLDLVLEAGLPAIRAKSVLLTEFLIRRWRDSLEELGFELRTPAEPESRGSHVSLGHPQAFRICQALIELHGVIPDFRAPDNIRLGVSPLYTTFAEVERAVEALAATVTTGQYEQFCVGRPGVT